jgi:hypothetical protein
MRPRWRQRADHLQRRVDRRLGPPREADGGAECDAKYTAEQQAFEDPDAGHPQRIGEFTAAHQFDARLRDQGWRG